MNFFLRGLIVGFSIAAPVGPIGILCIRRTLANGRLSGFVSGLGAASADALYGSIAALGLTLITNFLVAKQDLLGTIGGIFLCYLGIRTFMESPSAVDFNSKDIDPGNTHNYTPKSLLADYGSTLFLTLTNPLTILAFAAIYAGLGLAQPSETSLEGISLVLGVFMGSAMWWFILSSIAQSLRNQFMTIRTLRWVNRISGVVIIGFGAAAIWM